jgi:hypothetical protein
MRSEIKERASWPRERFWGVVGVLCVLQAGLIFLFGDRSRALPPLSSQSVRFRALGASVSEDQLLRQFFVGDPAVFPLPNPHGFSSGGWLDQRPLTYQAEIQLEPPIWLDLDTARLRSNLPVIPSSFSHFVLSLVTGLGTNLPADSGPIPLGLAEKRSRFDETAPVFLSPEIIPTKSNFRLEGGLGDRLQGPAPALRSWSSEQLLTKSVVQIAVNAVGEVVATRLDARCGLTEADAEALATARALRFRPSPSVGLQWGQAVFQWQTAETPAPGPPK